MPEHNPFRSMPSAGEHTAEATEKQAEKAVIKTALDSVPLITPEEAQEAEETNDSNIQRVKSRLKYKGMSTQELKQAWKDGTDDEENAAIDRELRWRE